MTNKNDFNLSPKEYQAILKNVELRSIILKRLETKIDTDISFERLDIDFVEDASYKKKDDEIIILHEFSVIGYELMDAKHVIDLSGDFQLTFSGDEHFNDDFFKIYKKFNLPIITMPYFRELITTMTSRMGIPPIVLPLYKAF